MTTNEEYSLTCYDFQILYIPSLSHLENLQYTDSDHQRYSILKRTDIQVDLKNDHESNISHVLTSIGSLEVQLTNKELKELKNFIDNLSQYHSKINLEVLRELRHIETMNRSIKQFEKEYDRMAGGDSDSSEEEEQKQL